MEKKPFFEDIGKLASSSLGMLDTLRKEMQQNIKQQCERIAVKMDFVPREEFDVLKARVEKLEAELAEKNKSNS